MIRPGDIWYGPCAYWTDDLSKLGRTTSGIPCCPNGHVGYEIPAKDWWEGARRFESAGNPGYVAHLEQIKETCSPPPWGKP